MSTKKTYTFRSVKPAAKVAITWQPLDPRWSIGRLYGPMGRYVVVGFTGKPYRQYLRNPEAKPLLSNGRKAQP